MTIHLKHEDHIPTILVADDDLDTRNLIKHYLEAEGFKVVLANDGCHAMAELSDEIDVALYDVFMPKATGLDCLRFTKEKVPDTVVIMISASGQISDAVEAMKEGAFHYLTKPFKAEELLVQVRHALRSAQLVRDNQLLREALNFPLPSSVLVGQSPAMQALLNQIPKVACLDSTVLITGESGTGKTTIARMIHQAGQRVDNPFIAVSCAALPRDLIEAELFGHERGAFTGAVASRVGRAEMADEGTLFLDEIGDLPLELQPKLLTFLEDRTVQRLGGTVNRRVNVRFIAATHKDLKTLCEEKSFREDLFFRINVLALHLPPLRQRREDIIPLVEGILTRIARQRNCSPFTLSDQATRKLQDYDWPGNIRELENVLERATAYSHTSLLGTDDIDCLSAQTVSAPPSTIVFPSAGPTLVEMERKAIVQAIHACHGNKAAAARQLGVSEKSIYNKIKRFKLSEFL